MHCLASKGIASAIGLFLITTWKPMGAVLVGPFVPGTGNWQNVLGGGFEGPTLDGYTFFASSGASGTAAPSVDAAYLGVQGLKLEATSSFTGPGISLHNNNLFFPLAGQEWVVSAFVRTPSPVSANTYIDQWDAFQDINVYSNPGETQWQFVYQSFIAHGNQIGARVVLDGIVTSGNFMYVDELALTRAENFSPPEISPIPEPISTELTLAVTAVVLVLAGWRPRPRFVA